MKNKTRHAIAKTGIWGVCIAYVLCAICSLSNALRPFYFSAAISELSTTALMHVLYNAISIASYSMIAIGFNNRWIRTFSICAAICAFISMFYNYIVAYTPISNPTLSAIIAIIMLIGCGALCCLRQLWENKRNLLIGLIGLVLAIRTMMKGLVLLLYYPIPKMDEILNILLCVQFLCYALDIVCAVLWILLWKYIYCEVWDNREECPEINKLLVNKYSVTFVGVFLFAIIFDYIFFIIVH